MHKNGVGIEGNCWILKYNLCYVRFFLCSRCSFDDCDKFMVKCQYFLNATILEICRRESAIYSFNIGVLEICLIEILLVLSWIINSKGEGTKYRSWISNLHLWICSILGYKIFWGSFKNIQKYIYCTYYLIYRDLTWPFLSAVTPFAPVLYLVY